MNGGGAERALLLLARFWPQPTTPIVIVRSELGAYREELRNLMPGQVAILDLPKYGLRASLQTPLALARVVDRYQLDVVITFLSLPSVATLRLLRPHVTLVASIQNPPGATNTTGLRQRIKDAVVRLAGDVAASALDAIASPSAGTFKQFEGRPFVGHALSTGRTSWCVVPNPVDPALLNDRRKTHARSSGIPTVVAVGRLVRQKRFDLFIQAVAELRKSREVTARIFGEGPLRGQLTRQASEAGLQGLLTVEPFQHDLDRIYGEADVFVSASDFEGFGNVLVEALAYGIPVVSTDAPYGPAEILGGGQYGLLVPRGDSRQMAAAISQALPGGTEHSRLRNVAQQRARRYAAPDVAAEMYACALAVSQKRR